VTFPQQLSPFEHGIWFTEQTQPVGSAYHLALRLTFTGPLEMDRLRAACDAIVAQQPVLATAVRITDGLPKLTAAATPRLEEVGDRGSLDARLIEPFALDKGPLCRFMLYRAAPESHELLVVAHHLVFDGDSKDLFIDALATAYRKEPLPPLAGGDEPEPDVEAAQVFWSTRWQQPEEVQLPGDVKQVAPAAPGVSVRLPLDEAAEAAIRILAERTGATRFEVLLAVLRATLLRYGNAEATVAVDLGARGPATRNRIGTYVNQLPVTGRLDPQGTFHTAVLATRAHLRIIYPYRRVPLGRAVRGLTGALSMAPVSVSYRRAGMPPQWPDGLRVDIDRTVFNRAGRGTLHLQAVDGPDELTAAFHFRSGSLTEAAVERMAGHLVTLLRGAAATPGRPIDELPLLTAAERDRLRSWNATTTPYPDHYTVDELLSAPLRARPHAPAVESDGPDQETLTGGELDAAANRFAHEIRDHGVRPGRVVAVLAPRSADLIVGVLAVLKSGAVYLPLDPDLPDSRLHQMIADSGADLVLSASRLAPRLATAADPPRILLLEQPPTGQPTTVPVPLTVSSDPAYLIYTSGSTGMPKGVLNSHRGLCNRLDWMQRAFPLDESDAVLHKTPVGFDVSVWELLWPLLAGARLVMAAPGGHRDPAYLGDVIDRRHVTTLHFVPSMLQAFLADTDPGRCASLRRTICSGEELTPATATDFLQRMPGELHNLYGPTEAAIDVTAWHCTEPEMAGRARLPIGRPIQNMRVSVTDPWGNETPIGSSGELVLAGPGIALGYHNDPELTAQRFLPDPEAGATALRYRTGDLGRWAEDGVIEYLGRIDRQLKMRGIRIEPGEIEAVLLTHPSIAAAAVTVTGDPDRRLVAGVTATPGATEGLTAQLRAYLAERLPEAMVPATVAVFDAMPLTSSGKLDYAAIAAAAPLAAPREPTRATATAAGEPDDDLSASARAIWAEVLGLTDIGADDDIFDLGAHSLTITQISVRMRKRLGVDLPMHTYYDFPTVAGILTAARKAA
jgi:amino acid adenylation domain-containing protein